MSSIAAINDTDSRGQWEPLAPSKEAQEFHLSKTYHEGLLKLHAKEFEKARELLESVLRDPLISSAQVDNIASDGHLLQLRFLSLKNLATTFLQQGSAYHENALQCYLQAVEIDGKDSVVWNQLGTLSCSMGLLSISRWAFEQGLLCSPSNWNCMEKLLEVLIAIGDEVACLSVAKMILRHWPSHSRALHVKNMIEEPEIIPFAPRGIDKLEPKHLRLKFPEKRKATDELADEAAPLKRSKKKIELHLEETSWRALADSLLSILVPLNDCTCDTTMRDVRSGDIQLDVKFPCSSENTVLAFEDGGFSTVNATEDMSQGGDFSAERGTTSKDKATSCLEEQPQERRSSRLERLRCRKSGKEESDYAATRDQAAVVKFLEPFISVGLNADKEHGRSARDSSICHKNASSSEAEHNIIARFLQETSGNIGAYHVAHLLLEEAANRRLSYQDAFIKFLDLEKLTRNWGQERTPECNLFLAELYYDLALTSLEASKLSELLYESSYHLCKVIESVALEHPLSSYWAINYEKSSSLSNPGMVNSLVGSNSPFWVRFFWLSGRLSVLDNDKAKAHKEFSLSLSVFSQKNDKDGPFSVPMPHCRIISELTLERVLYDINMLKLDILMENDATKMMDKGMYTECISLLIPFLFCTKEVYPDVSLLRIPADRISENVASVELLALDLLIRACEKTDPENHELYLNCHQRKLQILMGAAGADRISFHTKPFCQPLRSTSSDMEPRVSSTKQWNYLVAEEVKALSQCVSKVRIQIDQSGEHNGNIFSARSIRDMQYLLLAAMCQFVKMLPSKNSAGCLPANVTEQKQQGCFISAAIAFCKFQHLDPTVPIKTQVELIVAVHDLLAEYGLCCAGEGKNEDQEGTYLKFAMKHLLALDMKFKSTIQSPSNVDDTPLNQQKSEDPHLESNTQILDLEMVSMEAHSMENIAVEMTSSDSCSKIEKDHTSVGYRKRGMDGHSLENRVENKLAEYGGEMTEDEREELESRIDNALDQCFFCLYGLNLRSDSAYEDELVNHRNTSNGDYQTKEQCADVFQYILPYAKGSSRTGLVKLRRVLRTIRKHFPQPPEDILTDSFLDKFLDDAELNEDNLSEEAGSDGFLHTMIKYLFSSKGSIKNYKKSLLASSGPYMDVYCNLFFYLAQSEEMSATDKWTGFVLTKEGEDFVQQNANLFKYDLLYNPLRFESWQRLANIYDEEVDLLLNDGSKHINVMGWRKNASLPLRVETSRRRSRRCLIMSLALAKTPDEQSKIHEWLALVYYDSLQNVVPFYDQRSVLPTKDAMWMRFCENSLTQFKKAFTKKEDWSHAFYMGKLAEKLNYSHEMILSYYNEAISLNPSVVDSIYRMHASRLKLLYKYGKDMKVLKVVSTYCFSQTVKAAVDDILKIDFEVSPPSIDLKEMTAQTVLEETCKESKQLEEAWHMLYADCISALETCVEGDLKHFHKARYMLAQGFYRRALDGDLERAKDELSFCFKSSRSYFTINMWEIDGMVKKGRRKAPGTTGNKKVLEVHLPESSRKFITCIRKYLLFYLRLLEEAKDTHTLDKAFISIRADKRFSLCVEDLVPVALGRYIKALLISMHQTQSGMGINSENILERLFSLFMEQGNLWADLCSLPEMKGSGISENNLYGYLHQYIYNLERNGNLETIEAINERVRKRFKNPKLSNSSCAKVCRHASVSWCRSLIVSLALITPLQPESSIEVKNYDTVENPSESSQQYLFVDLQAEELWNSSFEDSTQLKQLERKWIPILNKIKNAVIRKASDQNFDSANTLLRCAYNFFRESSCATLPTGVKLYLVPKRVALQMQLKPLTDGAELLDVNLPRKLLLWAYTLVHGHWTHISAVLKYCEENVKPKMKKGVAATGTHMSASTSSISACKGVGKDGAATHGGSNEPEPAPVNRASPTGERSSLTSSREGENRKQTSTSGNQIPSGESRKSLLAAPLQQCTNLTAESSSSVAREGGLN